MRKPVPLHERKTHPCVKCTEPVYEPRAQLCRQCGLMKSKSRWNQQWKNMVGAQDVRATHAR
jgi:ribosomal protein L37E